MVCPNDKIQDVRIQIQDVRIQSLETNISDIKNSIHKIQENHLTHIEVNMASMKTNIDWLLRYHWIVATASIGALVAGIINLII